MASAADVRLSAKMAAVLARFSTLILQSNRRLKAMLFALKSSSVVHVDCSSAAITNAASK